MAKVQIENHSFWRNISCERAIFPLLVADFRMKQYLREKNCFMKVFLYSLTMF